MFVAGVNYISEESLRRAREMESRFTDLPPSAGVLFVAVQPQPNDSGHANEFFVRLGITRRFGEDTGKALIRKVLSEEIKSGIKVFGGVYRGVSGTCRDDGSSAASALSP